MRVQVLVATKAPDAIAQSAFGALTSRLGVTRLSSLGRRVYFELELPGRADEVAQAVQRLLTKTTLLANPNKERAVVTIEPERFRHDGAMAVVWDREGPRGAALEARIRRQLPDLARLRVRRGTLWLPVLESDDEPAAALVERITRVRTRTSGLLANPNADAHAVFEDEIPHGVLFEASDGGPSAK